jgi:glucose-6-phosphate 1-dehydrogenase
MAIERSAIVILGASGDLARRKLIPALARLCERGEIGESCVIVGEGRTPFDDESFRAHFDITPEFARHLFYHRGLPGLKRFVDEKGSFDHIIFFLALPPAVYAETAAHLAAEGFGKESTLIIEKPFGYNYDSARKLDRDLSQSFHESQIFRIDHYLAKEAVQNILVFRFANSLFYPVWNSRHIESIQISGAETLGVEERGGYFDRAGIIRDMVQNHLMQLLCLMTMEAPVTLDAEEIRAQKIDILKAVRIDSCCRMQYEGYRDETGVATNSQTETYAELKLFIDSFRWSGMPIYIRAGKALGRKGTEVGVRFKSPPRVLFNRQGDLAPNVIVFKIQPAEGIIVDLATKAPGGELRLSNTNLTFCYRDSFEGEIPEAYQRLLMDALRRDRTLFVNARETELAWKKLDPFLDSGNVGLYSKGAMPRSCLGAEWIDFDKYKNICM